MPRADAEGDHAEGDDAESDAEGDPAKGDAEGDQSCREGDPAEGDAEGGDAEGEAEGDPARAIPPRAIPHLFEGGLHYQYQDAATERAIQDQGAGERCIWAKG